MIQSQSERETHKFIINVNKSMLPTHETVSDSKVSSYMRTVADNNTIYHSDNLNLTIYHSDNLNLTIYHSRNLTFHFVISFVFLV